MELIIKKIKLILIVITLLVFFVKCNHSSTTSRQQTKHDTTIVRSQGEKKLEDNFEIVKADSIAEDNLHELFNKSQNCLGEDSASIFDVINFHKEIKGKKVNPKIRNLVGLPLLGEDLIEDLENISYNELKRRKLIETRLRKIQWYKGSYKYKTTIEMHNGSLIDVSAYYEFLDDGEKYETDINYQFRVTAKGICLIRLVFAG